MPAPIGGHVGAPLAGARTSPLQEPNPKRAIVFIDGQNLFYAVKHAFGYKYPNYNVVGPEKPLKSLKQLELSCKKRGIICKNTTRKKGNLAK